jgi:UDP-glucose 4-epimerase
MKIVVTGGTGFVGASIARVLGEGGHQVVATFRSAPGDAVREYIGAAGKRVALVQTDVTNRDQVSAVIERERPDAVVHAAVHTSIPPELERTQPDQMIQTNLIGTSNVMAAAGRWGVSRAIYVSSSAVYPPGSISDPPITESDPPRPTRLYGITKHAAELIWRRMADLHGLSAASARIVAPYGPLEAVTRSRSVMSPMHDWISAARDGRPLRVPAWPASKDWTYVVDTARAIASLATADRLAHDTYHVGCGRLWTVEQVVGAIRNHYPDVTVEHESDPNAVNPNVGQFGLKAMLAIDRIRADVGFVPAYDLGSGIAAYVAWQDGEGNAGRSPSENLG